MATSNLPDAERREPGPRALAARAFMARARTGLDRSLGVLAPRAARLNARLRAVPAIAVAQDRVRSVWDALVEAFCQTIEPLLERRFPEARLVAIADAAGSLTLHRAGREGAAALGPLDGLTPEALTALAATRWSAVELRLPATQVLERKLSLPAASRDFLGPILEHRLDRLTPWKADKVLYGWRVAEGDAGGGGVAVAVTATSRDLVAAPLQRLGAAGLVATAIGADVGAPDGPLAVDLLGAGAGAPTRRDSRRFVSRVALALGAALVLAWGGTALLASQADADQLAATQRLAKARRLLRAASVGGSREQALLETKQPARSTMMLIERLATAIPADTYLKELTVAPDKLRLTGSSANAPALVAKLEGAGLQNVRFTSTIARGRDGRDEFELSADRPQPKPEDTP